MSDPGSISNATFYGSCEISRRQCEKAIGQYREAIHALDTDGSEANGNAAGIAYENLLILFDRLLQGDAVP